ncbi:lipid-transfer protein [Gigaspora margarita]|uniref:Lipid-transfer protein n=1 Tax=Gigaspora margarita TaxID=4874 RepID=A0A8H4EPI6_GIGMA|nr:lipid-transfer protein [Gigaspora margarita]
MCSCFGFEQMYLVIPLIKVLLSLCGMIVSTHSIYITANSISEIRGHPLQLKFLEQYRRSIRIGILFLHGKDCEKNPLHSAKNPYYQFRDVYTFEQIKSSPAVFGPLTKIHCCPTSDGSGAVIMASETNMIRHAAKDVFEEVGVTADDVQVVELHDYFSTNELITYDALGLCKLGEAHKLIDTSDVTYVVNPSGDLISKGRSFTWNNWTRCVELRFGAKGDERR